MNKQDRKPTSRADRELERIKVEVEKLDAVYGRTYFVDEGDYFMEREALVLERAGL